MSAALLRRPLRTRAAVAIECRQAADKYERMAERAEAAGNEPNALHFRALAERRLRRAAELEGGSA